MQFSAVTLLDPAPGGNNNGRLGRGESGRLELAVRNSGGGGLGSVHVVVRSADPDVVMSDSLAWYGQIAAGQTASGAGDRLAVQAPLDLPRNQPVTFRASVWADGGTYHYADTFSFQVQGEQGTTADPTGPDAYGYWCYDNTDVGTGHEPTFNWVELAGGPGAVIPAVSDSDAATRALTMPFTFRYYNQTGTTMSACSNGWLCFGTTTSRRGTNNPMPDTASAAAMIAPFWDDLNPDENNNGYGTAYQYYDTANHRWIVEYKDFGHNGQPNLRETFEAIFYDPAFYPTPTGDGEFEYQYHTVSLGSSCTVGMEDQTELIGLQYVYNNSYAPTAAVLQAGRALRFTTWPPGSVVSPWLVFGGALVSDALYGNNNGIAEPGEVLTVVVNLRNSGAGDANNVSATLRALDSEGSVQDSTAGFGNIVIGGEASNAADPFTYQVAAAPGDSIAEVAVALTADGYSTIAYFSFELGSLGAIAAPRERLGLPTALGLVRPNPVRGQARVTYTLARTGRVDLALFDAAGRRVRTIARGTAGAGVHDAGIEAQELSHGVYFCRLAVTDAAGTYRFTRKLQLVE
jgi:hypothetical protein